MSIFSSDSSDDDSSSSSDDEADSVDNRPTYTGQPGVCKLCRGDQRRNKDGLPEPLVRCAKCNADGLLPVYELVSFESKLNPISIKQHFRSFNLLGTGHCNDVSSCCLFLGVQRYVKIEVFNNFIYLMIFNSQIVRHAINATTRLTKKKCSFVTTATEGIIPIVLVYAIFPKEGGSVRSIRLQCFSFSECLDKQIHDSEVFIYFT